MSRPPLLWEEGSYPARKTLPKTKKIHPCYPSRRRRNQRGNSPQRRREREVFSESNETPESIPKNTSRSLRLCGEFPAPVVCCKEGGVRRENLWKKQEAAVL